LLNINDILFEGKQSSTKKKTETTRSLGSQNQMHMLARVIISCDDFLRPTLDDFSDFIPPYVP